MINLGDTTVQMTADITGWLWQRFISWVQSGFFNKEGYKEKKKCVKGSCTIHTLAWQMKRWIWVKEIQHFSIQSSLRSNSCSWHLNFGSLKEQEATIPTANFCNICNSIFAVIKHVSIDGKKNEPQEIPYNACRWADRMGWCRSLLLPNVPQI